MKPHVICHMLSSVDGRILGSRWRPRFDSAGLFEKLHDEIGGDAWLVGRVTGREFAKREAPYPERPDARFPREPWFAAREADAGGVGAKGIEAWGVEAWGVVLDAEGKIAWGRSDIGGDPIVVVLTEAVSDSHLAGLREEGVSYIFAGAKEIDLAAALETLNRELGVERLLMEGGGGANGELLRAGLIDELSLVVCPTVDGSQGAPCVFDGPPDAGRAPVASMTLTDCKALDGGAVWLRYRVENGSAAAV